eukprot:3941267-Rhodomonas_salina.1
MSGTGLCICYAVPGTEMADGRVFQVRGIAMPYAVPVSRSFHYAMPGTDVSYAPVGGGESKARYGSGTIPLYPPTRRCQLS